MISVNDLTTPLTEDQVLETFLSILETLSIPARSWRKGGALRTILRVVARSYAGFTVVMADWIRGSFLDLASGPWLTLLAFYVYGVTRVTATPATGSLTFVNAGGGVYSFPSGTLVVKNTGTGKTYFNQATVAIGAGATVTGQPFQASELGSASTSQPGTIDGLVNVVNGLTVTNPVSFVGTDDELDTVLQQRCRDKLGALSPNGPRGAYAFAVRSALRSDGTPVNINRVAISPSSSTGTVDVYCASPGGAPTSTDLAFVVTSIENIARPDSVTVNVHGATTVVLSSTLTVWALTTPGLDAATLSAAVSAALTAMVSTYPIGGVAKPPSTQGYLYQSTIEGAAKAVHPSIFAVDGAGADLPIGLGQVAALAATVNVRFVEGGTQ